MKYLDLTGLQYFYKKYIKTLGSAAKQAVANNLTTTAAGSVLDARQGKTLSDKIASETKTLNSEIKTINTSLGNIQAFAVKTVNISKPNTWEDQVIKFPKAFTKAPCVIVQAQTGQNDTSVWADAITTTQFTLKKYRPTASAFALLSPLDMPDASAPFYPGSCPSSQTLISYLQDKYCSPPQSGDLLLLRTISVP